MKITEDVRKYAPERGIAEEEIVEKGIEAKWKEFVAKSSEVYAKAQVQHRRSSARTRGTNWTSSATCPRAAMFIGMERVWRI